MAVPVPAKKHEPTRGDQFECRVARLHFAEGGFVRRKVDLEIHFGEPFQITDIDVLVLFFSETLELRRVLGECKTSEAKSAPTATDRLLWNAGLRKLLDAHGGFLAVHKSASPGVRRLAQRLHADVLDPGDLERRERLQDLGADDHYGSHHGDLVALQRQVRDISKAEDQVRRVYMFVRSEFWFSPPVAGLKRALGALRTLTKLWSSRLPDEERYTVEWLAREAIICASVAMTELAGECYRQPSTVFARSLGERLAEGLAPYRSLEALSEMVDKYVLRILSEANVEPAKRVESLGAFAPSTPRYAEPLLEVIARFAAEPRAAREVARWLDWRSGAVALAMEAKNGDRFFHEEDETQRLARVLARFLVGQIGLHQELISFMDGDSSDMPSRTADRRRPTGTQGSEDTGNDRSQLELKGPRAGESES